jgi:hypothetical protein
MTSPPHWLADLASEVTAQLAAVDVLAPIGCHYYYNGDEAQWEVTLFASNTETVGGPSDGRLTHSNFTANLSGLAGVFSAVFEFHWQALRLGDEDEIGPHISIEGLYRGEPVWLRLLATPPAQFEAGRILNTQELRLENRW